MVQTGETPERPPGRIGDSVWSLLEGCWSKIPANRPPIVELRSIQMLSLHFLAVSLSWGMQALVLGPKDRPLYLKLQSGEMSYTTPRTNSVSLFWEWWYAYAHLCLFPCR